MSRTIANAAAVPKVRRVRVYTRLSHPLRKRLAAYCAATGRSERAVIEEGVAHVLDDNKDNPSATTAIDRLVEAIDNDQRRRDQQHRDLEILSEAFGRFVRLWMVIHAASFSDPTTAAATNTLSKQLAAGENLYGRFAATIAHHFAKGHRFTHDLAKVEPKPDTERGSDP
jgi:predicted DNA-binding protein